MHLLIETMRRAYYDRARHLGDSDFVSIPKRLTSKQYAKRLASEIDLTRATDSAALATDIPLAPESPQTTHFSVIVARNGKPVLITGSPGGRTIINTQQLQIACEPQRASAAGDGMKNPTPSAYGSVWDGMN